MTVQSEQFVHDKINLGRLIRRLEATLAEDTWHQGSQQAVWVKAQGILTKVKFATKLLKEVESNDPNPTPKANQRYRKFELTLSRIEASVLDKHLAPPVTRPIPLLPQIPLPIETPASPKSSDSATLDGVESPEPPDDIPSPVGDHLLLPADLPSSPPTSTSFSFPPPAFDSTHTSGLPPRTARTLMPAPAFLQNSGVVQQELSEQLAQMAAQLKRNATHFSETLAKDQAVVEDAKAKIEGNFDVMQTQRVRLRDHRGKSGSTTCLVLLSILAVVISFVVMIFVIRMT